eukprot:TRINITY_DN9911_c0_g1_i1.p1 TRINITY_DN9911_c0_g1~~TRINITY_DN9911_c0_g1_i1.p1  ORF type:complete len:1359 (-),score=249.35 TRINITY_DN9911_c0_g1_i1:815-4642(-)
MSLHITIRFTPDSLRPFSHTVSVTSEKGRFDIPIVAMREPPRLTLAEVLDVGNVLQYGYGGGTFEIANVGGSATFAILDGQRSLSESGQDRVTKGPFTICPATFGLPSNKARDLDVMFTPLEEGSFEESFDVEADNGDRISFKLVGHCCPIDVCLSAYNGRPIDAAHLPLVVQFDNRSPGAADTRIVTVQNSTPTSVSYSWVIQHENSMVAAAFELMDFSNGAFPPNTPVDFSFVFAPKDVLPYKGVAHLFITQIPDDQGGFVERLAASITLQGEGQRCSASLSPPIITIPGQLPLGPRVKRPVVLSNNSQSDMEFSWSAVETEVARVELHPSSGLLPGGASLRLDLCVIPRGKGRVNTTLTCQLTQTTPLALMVQACIEGPRVRIREPCLDFGLVRLHAQAGLQLTLKNDSKTPARVVFCERGDVPLPFIPVLAEDGSMMDVRDLPQRHISELRFNPPAVYIPAEKTASVEVVFAPTTCRQVRTAIEAHVENGETLFLRLHADVQQSKVCLVDSLVSLGELFVGVTKTVKVRMQNLSMLPARFSWDEHPDEDCEIYFEPSNGVIMANELLPITVTVLPRRTGLVDFVIGCDVDNMDMPLVCGMKGEVSGLRVSYRVLMPRLPSVVLSDGPVKLDVQAPTPVADSGDDAENVNPAAGETDKADGSQSAPPATTIEAGFAIPPPLVMDFGELPAEGTHQARFVITNESGIDCRFQATVERFAPLVAQRSAGPLQRPISPRSRSAHARRMTPLSPNSGKTSTAKSGGKTKRLLSDDHERLKPFQSVAGQTLSQTKLQSRSVTEAAQRIIPEGSGFAVAVSPAEGIIKAFGQLEIVVSCHVTMPGVYSDALVVVVDTQTVRVPIRLTAVGTLLSFAPGVGMIAGRVPYTMTFPELPALSPAMTRLVTVLNSGPIDMRLDMESLRKNADNSVVECALRVSDDCEVEFDLKPWQDCVSDQFTVHPRSQVVRANGRAQFTVTYRPGQVGSYNSYLRGTPSVAGSQLTEHTSYPMAPLTLDLCASTFQPRLRTDLKQQLRFRCTTSDAPDSKCWRRKVALTNTQPAPLTFTLSTAQPFAIASTVSSAPKHPLAAADVAPLQGSLQRSLKGSTIDGLKPPTLIFTLPPNDNVEVEVAFLPLSLNVERTTGLLIVHFSNGSQQEFDLLATIEHPLLAATPSSLEFGVVRIGSYKELAFALSNPTEAEAVWNLQPSLQKDTSFTASVERGQLRPCNGLRPAEQRVEIRFVPKSKGPVSGQFTFSVANGPNLTVFVTGEGSYEEHI